MPAVPSKHENAGPAFSSPAKEGGEPSLFLAPSEQFKVDGIESEGVPVSERRIGGHDRQSRRSAASGGLRGFEWHVSPSVVPGLWQW